MPRAQPGEIRASFILGAKSAKVASSNKLKQFTPNVTSICNFTLSQRIAWRASQPQFGARQRFFSLPHQRLNSLPSPLCHEMGQTQWQRECLARVQRLGGAPEALPGTMLHKLWLGGWQEQLRFEQARESQSFAHSKHHLL